MGLLSSLFKILHPVRSTKRRVKRTVRRAVVPRPVRKATWIASGAVNPVSRIKYLVNRKVVRTIDDAVTPKPRRKRKL
jgi:hypothetical protein